MPKFVLLVRTDSEAEGGAAPSQELLGEMSVYNDSLKAAGILQAAEGFLPSSRGARLGYTASGEPEDVKVTPGPFPVDSLVAGFWVIAVKDLDEAIGWAKKVPFRKGEVESMFLASPPPFWITRENRDARLHLDSLLSLPAREKADFHLN